MMKIKTLVENTSLNNNFNSEHGLSLYIETYRHKILFDLGQSGLFLENAIKLGIDISDVDIVIISHGHNDHGGALKTFLDNNLKAKIYLNKHAFENHISIHEGVQKYIGLEKELKDNRRTVLVDGNLKIDDELFIFSDVTNNEYMPSSNSNLFMKEGSDLVNDDFIHEQNLIIKSEGKTVLIGGCAHKGIVNIQERASEILKKDPDYCISGFHLSSNRTGHREGDDFIKGLAYRLLETETLYYTCHCTGLEAYKILKEIMKDRLNYLSTGSEIEL